MEHDPDSTLARFAHVLETNAYESAMKDLGSGPPKAAKFRTDSIKFRRTAVKKMTNRQKNDGAVL